MHGDLSAWENLENNEQPAAIPAKIAIFFYKIALLLAFIIRVAS